MKPLCYPPANLIRGKLSFYWSSECHSTFHPQGRNVNDVTNEEKLLLMSGKVEVES